METRQHQPVRLSNNQFVQFRVALETKELMRTRVKEIENHLKQEEKKLKIMTQAIQNACDHKWIIETEGGYQPIKWWRCETCCKLKD